MATPGQLISTVANVLGVPEATVTSSYRTLREADLVAKAGRGRGSVESTAQDAANLLTALCAGSLVKEAAHVVQDYSTLPLAALSMGGLNYHRAILAASPALDSLPFTHRFGQALAGLIEAAGNGSLSKGHFRSDHDNQFIEVTFYGPFRPVAAIHIKTKALSGKIFYESSFDGDENNPNLEEGCWIPDGEEQRELEAVQESFDRYSKELREKNGYGDLQQIRKFSELTIFAVGETLKN